MNYKLDKSDVLMIFAAKDNRIQEWYNEYYGAHNGQPTDDTLYSISKSLIDKINAWPQVMLELQLNKTTKRIMNEFRFQEKHFKTDIYHLGVNLAEPTLEEWMWYAIRIFFQFRKVTWMDENAPVEWKIWVQEARAKYKKEEISWKEKNFYKKKLKKDMNI